LLAGHAAERERRPELRDRHRFARQLRRAEQDISSRHAWAPFEKSRGPTPVSMGAWAPAWLRSTYDVDEVRNVSAPAPRSVMETLFAWPTCAASWAKSPSMTTLPWNPGLPALTPCVPVVGKTVIWMAALPVRNDCSSWNTSPVVSDV